jgi:hypothetical protein
LKGLVDGYGATDEKKVREETEEELDARYAEYRHLVSGLHMKLTLIDSYPRNHRNYRYPRHRVNTR